LVTEIQFKKNHEFIVCYKNVTKVKVLNSYVCSY